MSVLEWSETTALATNLIANTPHGVNQPKLARAINQFAMARLDSQLFALALDGRVHVTITGNGDVAFEACDRCAEELVKLRGIVARRLHGRPASAGDWQ